MSIIASQIMDNMNYLGGFPQQSLKNVKHVHVMVSWYVLKIT